MYFPTVGGLMLTLFTLILNKFYSVFAISSEIVPGLSHGFINGISGGMLVRT